MRAVAALLVVAMGCSTTSVTVTGAELHRHLHELRTTGHAGVDATRAKDEADGTAVRAEVRFDQRVVFDREVHAIAELAIKCPDEPGDTRIEGCTLSMFRDDKVTLSSDRHFQPGTAGLVVIGVGLFAGYGTMAYCAWNCENEKAANISLVGLGLWAVLTVVLGLAQRRARGR